MGVVRKVTRRAFQRKVVTTAVSIFTSGALLSTGFATWVVAATAKKAAPGNVRVGTVAPREIVIEVDESVPRLLCFEPEENDNSGHIRWDKTNAESLTFPLKAKIHSFSSSHQTFIAFHGGTVDEEGKPVIDEDITQRLWDAVAAGYITAPKIIEIDRTFRNIKDFRDIDITEYEQILTYDEETDTATLDMTIGCKWGPFFGGANPGHFYDVPGFYDPNGIEGIHKSEDDIDAEMAAFYTCFTGLDASEQIAEGYAENAFIVTITASTDAV